MSDENNLSINGEMHVQALSIIDLVNLARCDKLVLPPIQRTGGLWKHSQISEFWDSILRGFPIPPMSFHPIENETCRSLVNDKPVETKRGHIALFDGQQRMATILLGFGKGSLRTDQNLKIWVSKSKNTKKLNNNLLFNFKFTSIGQPFGYPDSIPNYSWNNWHHLSQRRERRMQWLEMNSGKFSDKKISPRFIFDNVCADDIIGENDKDKRLDLISLEEITTFICNGTEPEDSTEKNSEIFILLKEILTKKAIVSTPTPMQTDNSIVLVNVNSIANHKNNYRLLFDRIGSNGTALSPDEKTYSFIKFKHPFVHEAVKKILEPKGAESTGGCGRISTPINLAISALRIAKCLKSSKNGSFARPTADHAARLNEKELEEINQNERVDWAEINENFKIIITSGALERALKHIRTVLEYNPNTAESKGLPTFMLQNMPDELLDCLLLSYFRTYEINHNPTESDSLSDRQWMIPFCLIWLAFVTEKREAATLFGNHYFGATETGMNARDKFDQDFVKSWYRSVRSKGNFLSHPNLMELCEIESELKRVNKNFTEAGCFLTNAIDVENGRWLGRFGLFVENIGADGKQIQDENGKITWHSWVQKKQARDFNVVVNNYKAIWTITLWLQRKYLANLCSKHDYDPTASYDEDFPIELDHLIPQSIFYYSVSYGSKSSHLDQAAYEMQNSAGWKLHNHKYNYGNSLGNFRWLDASVNASKGKGEIKHSVEKGTLIGHCKEDHLIDDYTQFNGLINADTWGNKQVNLFETLIDQRSIDLYRAFIVESGINDLLPVSENIALT